ncbi:hypothetical protein N9L03_01890 [Alphaproteobacteria bacterium]|nr:hypothetical protein [Alphaproteobacteria bacterium]MDA8725961.1 hypothetical protein [Alphaproteobacteria bacterium]MDA8817116.1 hypothetical protein [Alphaproteobacteria bacterium]
MRDKSELAVEMINRREQVGYLAMAPCYFAIFFTFMLMPSKLSAQIIGDIGAGISLEGVVGGNTTNGFGLAALRYEDKQRLKRLRERYLELNPKRKGIVSVYDIDTKNAEAVSVDEILEEVKDDTKSSDEER